MASQNVTLKVSATEGPKERGGEEVKQPNKDKDKNKKVLVGSSRYTWHSGKINHGL